MQVEVINNTHWVKHPLLSHKLTILRDKNTGAKLFSETLTEITAIIGTAATASLATTAIEISTPLTEYTGQQLQPPYPVIVPILRAGLGMLAGMRSLLPMASVGHIGLFRNEKSLKPESYYFKVPAGSGDAPYFVIDPMIATGGSAVDAIAQLKENHIHNITLICIVAARDGLKHFEGNHPDVPVYVAAIDEALNEHGYILPGLGDAGDRLYGTM